MHLERMKTLRDHLRTLPPNKFRMESYLWSKNDADYQSGGLKVQRLYEPDCQTAACVAGWTCALFGEQDLLIPNHSFRDGQRLLDLSDAQAEGLFTPCPAKLEYPAREQKTTYRKSLSAHTMAHRIDRMIRREERARRWWKFWARDPQS